jgi:hypothetical protein
MAARWTFMVKPRMRRPNFMPSSLLKENHKSPDHEFSRKFVQSQGFCEGHVNFDRDRIARLLEIFAASSLLWAGTSIFAG